MNTFAKVLGAVTASFFLAGTAGAQTTLPGAGKTVHYAQDDSLGGNYVVAQITSQALKKLGYDVRLSTMDTTLFFQAVSQGDMDLATDVTLPQREPGFRAIARQATLVGDGMIIGGGINGYLVDRKTAVANNITNLQQMKDPKIAGLFGSDGKAEMISCDPAWSCGVVVDYQLDKFGLKQTVKPIRGKYEALMADVVAKVRNGKPAFYYAWSPSWMTNALKPGSDVVWLPTPQDALPPDVPARGSALVKGVVGCAGGADPCRMAMGAWNYDTVANKQFLAGNPAVKALLEQIRFPLSTWSEWEGAISKEGGSVSVVKKLSDSWIASNQSQFDQWVATASKAR
ncbi:glycine betaine/L-proline ABC transporter substrate-binding protein ProX [Paraburkholderia phenoliruptrix]|uniref:Glycine betaine/proline transport system substrate-binding protein n=2 Tax=Paraburkholderia phenoliruptrix TaxID=252970 RepID=K0DQJ7_9BURK|nr:glycine betaine/L-proline ABC transporter substrate-binding protein ProX [Paraburkholderia phenoliruptrix]AFT88421.1 glycine betaine/proline transport system substrate-binding protein [Paraburkholderia phenoliruptrix BR3459a]MDR6418680.1 glycine betaine/proline transport system substrate-binding protein [Paraburkholderia phenoliruptrix]CAB4047349.1 Glycine betaine/proline betaine-binding periplasmic protein [Paraburkholderia phenoliruptrix]